MACGSGLLLCFLKKKERKRKRKITNLGKKKDEMKLEKNMYPKMETVKNGYKISHMHSGNVKKSLTQAGFQKKLCFPKYI